MRGSVLLVRNLLGFLSISRHSDKILMAECGQRAVCGARGRNGGVEKSGDVGARKRGADGGVGESSGRVARWSNN